MTGQTFIDIVQQQARARPTALAYRCGDRRWTFADVERDTNRIANTLAAMGLGRGDRVAALTKFHVEAALLTLAPRVPISVARSETFLMDWRPE